MTDMDKVTRYADAIRAMAADDWPPGSEEQAEAMVNDLTEEEFAAMQALAGQRAARSEEQMEAAIEGMSTGMQQLFNTLQRAQVSAQAKARQRQLERLAMVAVLALVAVIEIRRWSR